MADWIGRTLGRVRIDSLVARGGMAEVYLGMHTTLHREVAVKILRSHLDEDRRPRERFELEARAVAKLRHPNIVQVFDFDTIDDQPYIVMEYIRGPSLSRYLSVLHAAGGRIELPLIARIITAVGSALQYAHESGVIHRDVKPGNILLTSRSTPIVPGQTLPLDFEPVLTDFGLVRLLDSSRQTTAGQTAGTPAYMSPEQAMGITTDGRTDVYSLGVVLYEMLSGSVPFDGETTMSVLLKHLNQAPPPIPGLSPSLQAVLDRALAKMADDRFQEPEEFAAAFNGALEESADASTILTITRVREPARPKPEAPAARGRRWGWRQAALIAGLIGLAGLFLLFRGLPAAATPQTPTAPPMSDTPTVLVPVALGPTGMLQLRDGKAVLDRATLTAQALPAPPAGSHYEVWLVNGQDRLLLGNLAVDNQGRGSLTFDQPQESNLLSEYHGVEVTIQPEAGGDGHPPGRVAYASMLPQDGLYYLRGLMVSYASTPQKAGLIQGLSGNAERIDQAARDMLQAYQSGDESGVRQNAEAILNALVGAQSPEHRDWNGDGRTTDPGDGYGFLLNGDNLGYIQAVYSNVDYAVNAGSASRNMIVNGESVKLCAQNLARWAPELRDQALIVLRAGSLAEMESAVQRSAVLADQLLNGSDLNENGQAEAVAGECGARITEEYTYRMADMPLLPVNRLDTPAAANGTATPSQTPGSFNTPTATPRDNDEPPVIQPTDPPSQPTRPPSQPTRKPKPTDKPKPTKKP